MKNFILLTLAPSSINQLGAFLRYQIAASHHHAMERFFNNIKRKKHHEFEYTLETIRREGYTNGYADTSRENECRRV